MQSSCAQPVPGGYLYCTYYPLHSQDGLCDGTHTRLISDARSARPEACPEHATEVWPATNSRNHIGAAGGARMRRGHARKSQAPALPLNLRLFEKLGVEDEIRRVGMPKYGAVRGPEIPTIGLTYWPPGGY